MLLNLQVIGNVVLGSGLRGKQCEWVQQKFEACQAHAVESAPQWHVALHSLCALAGSCWVSRLTFACCMEGWSPSRTCCCQALLVSCTRAQLHPHKIDFMCYRLYTRTAGVSTCVTITDDTSVAKELKSLCDNATLLSRMCCPKLSHDPTVVYHRFVLCDS